MNWTELRDLLTRSPKPAVVGLHTSIQPRRDNGHGWPPASVVSTSTRFAHRPPNDWFLDHGDGDISLDVREPDEDPREEDAVRGLEFGADFPWDLVPEPARLIAPVPGSALTAATNQGEPTAVRHDGRDAWAVTLTTPSVPHPLHVVVDARTGILLAAEVKEAGYREELSELEFPGELPGSRFQWSDAMAEAEEAHQRRRDELAAHYREKALPVPAFWPGGRGHFEPHVFDGDLATGVLAIDLYNDGAPQETPAMAVLIRQQPDTAPFEPGWVADPQAFVHRWQDGNWQWTLALWGRPLSPDELERVKGSMAEN